MLIKREPPPIDEIAKRLAAQNAIRGNRATIETIGNPDACCLKCRARRDRSLKHCHMPAQPKPRYPSPRDTGAYVPELAARLDNDDNLTDGAQRCARKLAEYVYRKNRDGRAAEITVPYLMKALGRCRRTVQRYLRQLENEGYIDVRVVPSPRTRMCFGLLIRILNPLLPRHRRRKWPEKAIDRAVTSKSQNYTQEFEIRPIRRALWAFICADGVHRSYMKTLPPLPAFPALP
jgi:hypothetical protein